MRRKAQLIEVFKQTISAMHPDTCLTNALESYRPASPARTVVFGAGKAAAQIAVAFEDGCPRPLEGLVVTREGFGCATRMISVIKADHPVPTSRSVAAAEAMVRRLGACTPEDHVVFLLSGGASSLLARPAPGVTL